MSLTNKISTSNFQSINSRSSFFDLSSLIVQQAGVSCGPFGNDFETQIFASQEKLMICAEEFKKEKLITLSEQIEYSARSEKMGALGVTFSALGALSGGFSGPLGGIFSFLGVMYSSGDRSISEIKNGLKQLEKNIINVNHNLKKISNQINKGFNTLNKNIQKLSIQISQLEKNIHMQNLTDNINEDLIYVNDSVSKFLQMLINDGSEKLKKELSDEFSKELHIKVLNLYRNIVGSEYGVGENQSLFASFSSQMNLSEGNISYKLWIENLRLYLDKLNFPIILGSLAVCWATDYKNNKPEIERISNKYMELYNSYLSLLKSIEAGLFFPKNIIYNDESATLGIDTLEYTFERRPSGDKITITNPTDNDISLRQLTILSNFKMSEPNIGFWGDILYPDEKSGLNGSLSDGSNPVVQELISSQASDEKSLIDEPQFVAFTIQYAKGTYFKAKGKAVLNMSFSSNKDKGWEAKGISGLVGAPMIPTISFVNESFKCTMKMSKMQIIDPNNIDKPLPSPVLSNSEIEKGKRVVGYFPNYGMYNKRHPYFANSIPFNQMNIISYCFAEFEADGSVKSMDPWADAFNLPIVQQALSTNRTLMGELLLGGWPDIDDPKKDFNKKFNAIASNKLIRKTFAKNLAKTINEIGFSGIGIDWEYPTQEESKDYIAMLQEIKTELTKEVGNSTLSIAAPASLAKIKLLTDEQWLEIFDIVDFVNVMTYDYNGGWSSITDFMEPLYVSEKNPNKEEKLCVDTTMSFFIDLAKKNNVSLNKFALGLATYGRALLVDPAKVNDENKGLYIEHESNKVFKTEENDTGVFTNKELMTGEKLPSDMTWVTKGDAVKRQSAWGYSKATGCFISFDNQLSAQNKIDYEKKHELGGVIVWDLAGDANSSENSLLSLIAENYKEKN